MGTALSRVRLLLISGATLIFFGGLLVAIGRWNRAETDRAFVEAAALAARAPPPAGGVHYWAPVDGSLPSPTARIHIEAADRLRRAPLTPSQPAMTPQTLPLRPPPMPTTAP